MSLRTLWACLAIAAAVFLLYGQVGEHEFVNWDDDVYVYKNPHVRQGLTWPGLKWALTSVHEANWHPLTWLSHMLDAQLFGLEPGGHHLVSVGLHAVNSVLLFLALRLMTGSFWPCLLVAALFAVHPLRVESVAWVSERKEVLSGLFWMLSILAYVWYAKRVSVGRYLLVFGALGLGLMAKPMLVTLPLVLLLLDIWPLGRWPRPEGSARAPASGAISWLVLEKLPLLGLSAASCVITALAQKSGGALGSLGQLPLSSRLANAMLSYVAYLWKTLWPANLACFYPHPASVRAGHLAPLAVEAVCAALLLAAITFFVMLSVKRRPYLAVGWLWYVGSLVPVIGLVQVGEQAMADRYAYVPLIGIYLMAAWGAQELTVRRPRVRVALASAVALLLTSYMAVTWLQVGTWRNSRTLFEHALRNTEDNYVMHNNLGNVFLREADLARAASHYEQAIGIKPDYARAYRNLGLLLDRRGDTARAVGRLERAIQLDPGYAKPYNDLGLINARKGDLSRAVAFYERALGADPDHAEAHNNLGVVLEKQGRLEQAAYHFERTIRLNPTYAEAHNNLGMVFLRRGDLARAVAGFERALAIRPGYANAHNNLGIVLARQGDLARAAAHFENAVRLDPGNVKARENLNRARSMLGKSE